jgi:glutaminyl-peptide cyclotransferase
MAVMLRAVALILLAIVALPACGEKPRAAAEPVAEAASAAPPSDDFDARHAFALIRAQVKVGQRPAGSPQLRRLAVRLRRLMPEARFERIPGEPRLRNVVAVVPGRKPALVIGAHYDTLVKPKGFVGANNGAAGTAIVVELAQWFGSIQRPRGAPELHFVLFDGEEPAGGLPEEQADFYSTGLRGSRAYVDRHRAQVGAMVLLDYVAGKGLQLPREGTSDQPLWAEIRQAAGAAGAAKQFPEGTGPSITDDHTPFLRAGIAAVDLIDWNYPGHSLEDGVDKLSVRSVDAVGETLIRFVAFWRP